MHASTTGPDSTTVSIWVSPGQSEAIEIDEPVVDADLPAARRPPVEADGTPVEDAAVHLAVFDVHV
jgi:hypothetical protein